MDEFSDPSNPKGFDLQAWWEILPAAETDITTVTVKAGDSVTVTLWQVSSTTWEINLTDNTNGESYTTPPEQYSGPGSTAEWIVEATTRCSFRCVTTELAPYTPAVVFSNLGMTGPEGACRRTRWCNGRRGGHADGAHGQGFSVAYTGVERFARRRRRRRLIAELRLNWAEEPAPDSRSGRSPERATYGDSEQRSRARPTRANRSERWARQSAAFHRRGRSVHWDWHASWSRSPS